MKYDINEVIRLRDEEKLEWKQISEIIGVSSETLRKAYRRITDETFSYKPNPNSYENQKLRGLKRKYEIFMERGEKCERCGYHKNLGALEFHHLEPSQKDFQIDLRHFANTNLNTLKEELDKCILVCANCHRELHYPDLEISQIPDKIKQQEEKLQVNRLSFSNQKEKKVCVVCGKPLKTGKLYCSRTCAIKDRTGIEKYPEIDEILEQYKILHSWDKVAEYFGTTRKIIQGIRDKAGLLVKK